MSAIKEHHHDEIEKQSRNIKQVIHFLDPIKQLENNKFKGERHETMRCGYFGKENQFKSTSNPSEVTCTKCKSYINNPWRVLRKYAKVKVVESFFVMLWADDGYQFDVVATIDSPGLWMVLISNKNKIYSHRLIPAKNMTDLGFMLVKILEKEIAEYIR